MTATVTAASHALVQSGHDLVPRVIDGICVLLLIVLLVELEILRAARGPSWTNGRSTLAVAAAPLSVAALFIIVVRVLNLS